MMTRALRCNTGTRSAAGHWRRAVRRVGRPLALFAIVFQLTLLFAHHHFDLARAHAADDVAAPVALKTGYTSPADDGRDHAPVTPLHVPCVLCTAIHAAASPGAAAPVLVAPVAYGGAPMPRPAAALTVPPSRVAAFDPRGPPRA